MQPLTRSSDERLEWEAHLSLNRYAHEALGPEQWRLLQYFGKVMDGGTSGGLYVSGLPCDLARGIVEKLIAGEVVAVHLMHRHRSGNYEASSLWLHAGRLIMLFDDRSEFA